MLKLTSVFKDFLRNKYIKEHNEQNPDNKITEKEFNEMYKVIYPYVIPKEWHTDIINGFDEIIKEIGIFCVFLFFLFIVSFSNLSNSSQAS